MKALEAINITTKNILIIDDELNVREIVELCLKDLAGWNVVTADSPFTGLQRAVLDQPDAIVLDWSMRGMDNFKFIKQFKSHPQTQAIPLVLLSAKARWIDSQILREYQIVGVILKPFNPVTLPAQIAEILGWDFKYQ
ncbi:response regulator receiver domain protein [Anabaenopsis circularis NIES-21]|uniref:Response regulator receiver domain protein n=1 Tax=Anabaenopsis circularis NIES-21 TaxID=1085406 RepID=A0A1Z4GBW6_9CYAN|nr:response regulator receiver domain protein [Anabaenopsis circularis NIES-21]